MLHDLVLILGREVKRLKEKLNSILKQIPVSLPTSFNKEIFHITLNIHRHLLVAGISRKFVRVNQDC